MLHNGFYQIQLRSDLPVAAAKALEAFNATHRPKITIK